MSLKSLSFASLFLTTLTLVGCGQETYTVEHLVEDNELRSQILEDCNNNNQTTENCENAQNALSKVKYKEYVEKAFK